MWPLRPRQVKKGRDSERICNADKVIILGNSNSIFSAFGRFGELPDYVLLEQADFRGAYHLKSTGGKTEKCKTWKKRKIVPLLSPKQILRNHKYIDDIYFINYFF